MDIHANAITQIIDVAVKYSFDVKYNKLYHGKIPINPNKNGNIMIPHIPNHLNLTETMIYRANRVNPKANHKSLNVSMLSSHSHPKETI